VPGGRQGVQANDLYWLSTIGGITVKRFFSFFLILLCSACLFVACGGGGGGSSQATTYTVTYSGNGSTGGTVPVDSGKYALGQTVSVLPNTGNLVQSGLTFAGWNTQADGSGTAYAPEATFAMGSVNVTLYASWNPVSSFTVTYNGNGSTGGTVPTDTNTYLTGQTVTVLGNSGALVKSGFAFAGWNTMADGTGITFASGQTFSVGSVNINLYAAWTTSPTYTVSYNGNGSSGGGVPTDPNTYTQGQIVKVLGNSHGLVKAGFTFAGWNTAAAGTGTPYAAGADFPIGSANTVLYAMWTANPTFTVTYAVATGSTSTGAVPVDPNRYQQGSSVAVQGNPGNLAQNGYFFSGWNTKEDGSGTPYAQGQTFTMGSADLVLYANWLQKGYWGTYYSVIPDSHGNNPFPYIQLLSPNNTYSTQFESLAVAPSMAYFNRNLVLAYVEENGSNNLDVSWSQDGSHWSTSARLNQQTPYSPALAVFNNKLWVAFVANDGSGNLYVMSTADGQEWSVPTLVNQTTSAAPALIGFNGQLWIAFRAFTTSNTLFFIESTDGLGAAWSATISPLNQQTSASPSLTIYNDQLWVAFTGNTSNNVYIMGTTDGKGSAWTTKTTLVTGATVNGVSPAINVAGGGLLIDCFLTGNSLEAFSGPIITLYGSGWITPPPNPAASVPQFVFLE